MIDFREILAPDCTVMDVDAHSKKAALAKASELLAARHLEINARLLLKGLLDRERLGSTGLGKGVAIPHCRFEHCSTSSASCLRTRTALDFDAPDDQAVDLLFVLAVPRHEQRVHLQILGALARAFDDAANLTALRRAATNRELFDGLQNQLAEVQRE